MSIELINSNSLVLIGCGKMGSALLKGWLENGIKPESIFVNEPNPSTWLLGLSGINLNESLPNDAAVCVLAVKPQVMKNALPQITKFKNSKTVFLSIAAGSTIKMFEEELGEASRVIRAMPNTPASVNKGITAIVGNNFSSESDLILSESLMNSVGQTLRLESESQMDAVTAISGSGPAYVFYLIEALAMAGEKQGLSSSLSMKLAQATVIGAGVLSDSSLETPSQLRINVTSPGGTTQAALEVLMDEELGLSPLLSKVVEAATKRGKELGS
tara:strand:- start:1997 stop:2812 length:816 start_codon:yes stop_codon:yes gene_type:complete